MKKLLALILIVVLAVPASALAADQDPIVGSWYMYYEKSLSPEFADLFQNSDFVVCVYIFTEDGSIVCTESDITGKSGNPIISAAGKWSNENGEYSYSIVGLGTGKALIDEESILVQLQNSNLYMKFRKLIPFDFYADYVTK